MRLNPSDPDIETLLRRIGDDTIDLQPNFQRGEVWPLSKQKRLIDTIFRNWYIPPIHVIEHKGSSTLEVLDGQQRLAAIRDYAAGKFPFDGRLDPISNELALLDGLYFSSLPEEATRRFNRFPIRLYTIFEIEPGEPAELFFRLNQQVSLTAAEQRNAFYGPVRDQVHQLSITLEKYLGERVLGFGNSRMSYDDVIARVCVSLEQRTLRKKVTSSLLSTRYRSKIPFSQPIINSISESLNRLGRLVAYFDQAWRFNKPILHTWLLFLTQVNKQNFSEEQKQYLINAARLYHALVNGAEAAQIDAITKYNRVGEVSVRLLSEAAKVFHDRASSRVSDATSVQYRDIFLWLLFFCTSGGPRSGINYLQFEILQTSIISQRGSNDPDLFFVEIDMLYEWGRLT